MDILHLAALCRNVPVTFTLDRKMKAVHAGALICFAIAMACYALTWVPGWVGFGVVGAIFELVAWVKLFSGKNPEVNDS